MGHSKRRNRGVENLHNCRKVGAAKEGPPRRARNRQKNAFLRKQKEGIDSPAAHCFSLNAWRLGPRRICTGCTAQTNQGVYHHILALLGFAWLRLPSLGFAWLYLALLGFAWLCLALLAFAWLCLALLGFARLRLASRGFT